MLYSLAQRLVGSGGCGRGNDCLVDTEKQCIKMHSCFRLNVIVKTNTDIWIDINDEVKVAVILSKMIFSSSKSLHAPVQYVFF